MEVTPMPPGVNDIAAETGLAGEDLAQELVRRGLAGDLEEALLMVDVEAGGDGDIETLDP
jgi:hypothetical protein